MMGAMTDARPYDAILLVSFGGPEAPDEVVPFLENVTKGRGIPRERLEQVGQHYFMFGGRSPLNDLNRALIAAIRDDLLAAGIDLPVYWGNRNWAPYLPDALRQMRDDGVTRAACFITSAYSSYSGCRQYRENLADAVAQVPGAPALDRLRTYFNHPGFVEPFADATMAALEDLPGDLRDDAHLVFVTHSIPTAMNDASGTGGEYVRQHEAVVGELVARVRSATGRDHPHALVYCSRSGSPAIPWLEPDVNDHLEELAGAGVKAVAVVPLGFVADHMEVIYDLDTEALATAERLGLTMTRAATPGSGQRFVAMVRDLLLERAARERGEPVTPSLAGTLTVPAGLCAEGCCANLRGARPVVFGPQA